MSSPSSSTGSQMGDSSSSIPASILKQAQFAEFFISSLASAWFWDYLMSLREEFIMFSRHRFTFPDSVYVLSRLSTCAFLILSLMDISFNTGGLQNENCHTLIGSVSIATTIATISSCLLFFFRIRAVFFDVRIIVLFFFLLFLGTSASDIQSISSQHFFKNKSEDPQCQRTGVNKSGGTGYILILTYETLVYLAISVRLYMLHAILPAMSQEKSSESPSDSQPSFGSSFRYHLKRFFTGEGMGFLSKALFMSGQIYYLATIGPYILAIIADYNPSVPTLVKAPLTLPSLVLQNAMACRVYRHLKIGRTVDYSRFTVPTTKGGGHPPRGNSAPEMSTVAFQRVGMSTGSDPSEGVATTSTSSNVEIEGKEVPLQSIVIDAV
ncbi:hypothetical protein C8Q75DRAFT_469059 [Abortiporus biennis]|nr:hypothetical protein C8Q75DRAFT_469059 [Abortiporus biennis]